MTISRLSLRVEEEVAVKGGSATTMKESRMMKVRGVRMKILRLAGEVGKEVETKEGDRIMTQFSRRQKWSASSKRISSCQ